MKKKKWAVIGALSILLYQNILPIQAVYAEAQTGPSVALKEQTTKETAFSTISSEKSETSVSTTIASTTESSTSTQNSTATKPSAESSTQATQASQNSQKVPVVAKTSKDAAPKNGQGNSPDDPIVISGYTAQTEPGKYYKLVSGYIGQLTTGGTITEMTGGRILNATGGTIETMSGGLIGKVSSTNIKTMTGGRIQAMNSGTIDTMTGGVVVPMTGGTVNNLTGGIVYSSGGTLPQNIGGATAILRSEIERALSEADQKYSGEYSGQPINPFASLPTGWKNYVSYYYLSEDGQTSETPPTQIGKYLLSAKYEYPGNPAEGVKTFTETINNEDSFTIGIKKITDINWNTTDKVYDGNKLLLEGIPVGIVSGEDVAIDVVTKSENIDAGSYTDPVKTSEIKLTGSDRENYQLALKDSYDVSRKILPRSVTVKDLQVEDKIYDGLTVAVLPQQKSLTLENQLSSEPLSIDLAKAKANFQDKHAGVDKNVQITGAELKSESAKFKAHNYQLVIDPVKAAIEKRVFKNEEIFFTNQDKAFDNTDQAKLSANLKPAAIQVNEQKNKDQVVVKISDARYGDSSVGANKAISYNWLLEGADSGNYQLPSKIAVAGSILAPTASSATNGKNLSQGKNDPKTTTQAKVYPTAKTNPKTQAKTYPKTGEKNAGPPTVAGFGIIGMILIYLKKRKFKMKT